MNYDDIEDYDLLIEKPVQYYEKHKDDLLHELEWIAPNLYEWLLRMVFIYTLGNKEPIWKCPECGGVIEVDNDKCEEYCETCGLITRSTYPYTAGIKFDLPYGVRL